MQTINLINLNRDLDCHIYPVSSDSVIAEVSLNITSSILPCILEELDF